MALFSRINSLSGGASDWNSMPDLVVSILYVWYPSGDAMKPCPQYNEHTVSKQTFKCIKATAQPQKFKAFTSMRDGLSGVIAAIYVCRVDFFCVRFKLYIILIILRARDRSEVTYRWYTFPQKFDILEKLSFNSGHWTAFLVVHIQVIII